MQDERKTRFLQELFQKIQETLVPVVIGGDFNMIRYGHEKSSGNTNNALMEMFNGFINDCCLIEIQRIGSRYTWTNKQDNPVMCVLDRVLVSPSWEQKYPLAKLRSLTRLGSDHNPLMLELEGKKGKPQIFRFEAMWLKQEGFREMVIKKKIPNIEDKEIQEFWKELKTEIRKVCKGWAANLEGK